MSTPLVFDGLQISNWDREVLTEIRDGGVHGINATCAVWEETLETLRNIGDWKILQRENPELFRIVTSAQEIRECAERGEVSVVLGFQNTSPFGQDYSMVEVFWDLGVRIAQLTYNIQNHVGGACYDPHDSGLTRYGSIVVSEMNRVGMLIDLSHVGNRTSLDAVHASAKPVAITHANPLWFADTPRNKPDEVINAVAERGGVIGACLYPNVIGGKETTQEEFCKMVVRLVDQVGIEHVGLGSDCTRNWDSSYVEFLRDGRWQPRSGASWPEWPEWFSSPLDLPELSNALSDAGLDDDQLAAVMGENWLRLFEEVFVPQRAGEGSG
ncbi:MAG TPA: membrane dipeptidase [Candidatus Nanopelagicales bacterium]|nr:membrane dipeptidase [Candidatus Nanopelagicales bacterium]